MKIEIKNLGGDVIYETDAVSLREAVERAVADGADLSGANLSGVDLFGADLSRSNLSGSDLSGVVLSGADLSRSDLSRSDLSRSDLSRSNLSRSDLSGSNLSGADLSGAHLSGSKGVDPNRCTPLRLLLDQPSAIRLYKLINKGGVGIYRGGVTYDIGCYVSVDDANTDETVQCGAGINLATLDWCMREWSEGCRILIAEFKASDIAAIPVATDGKIRVHRCTIVGEKDLVELGLVIKTEGDGHVETES